MVHETIGLQQKWGIYSERQRKKERYIDVFEDQDWSMRRLVHNKNGVFTQRGREAERVRERDRDRQASSGGKEEMVKI